MNILYKNSFLTQFFIYFIIGSLSAIVNITVFAIVIAFHVPLAFSAFISFVLGAVVNYLLCLAMLFKHKSRWSAPCEIFAYIITVVVMSIFDVCMTWGFNHLGISAVWSKIWATGIGFIGNFLLRKYFVF